MTVGGCVRTLNLTQLALETGVHHSLCGLDCHIANIFSSLIIDGIKKNGKAVAIFETEEYPLTSPSLIDCCALFIASFNPPNEGAPALTYLPNLLSRSTILFSQSSNGITNVLIPSGTFTKIFSISSPEI